LADFRGFGARAGVENAGKKVEKAGFEGEFSGGRRGLRWISREEFLFTVRERSRRL
jgi:hypothetical protein